jgi:hypothetical protein
MVLRDLDLGGVTVGSEFRHLEEQLLHRLQHPSAVLAKRVGVQSSAARRG